MNFLLHLYLSGDDPEVIAGNLAGDFVKGLLPGRFPTGIESGLRLHRAIDSFASRNEWFIRSRRRIDQSCGLYRGVLVDLFYDHFLAREWDSFCRVPFLRYLVDARSAVEQQSPFLPPEFTRLVPVIFDELLPSYRERDGIARALARMSRRIARENPLESGVDELCRHHARLYEDFQAFMPEVDTFSRRIRQERGGADGCMDG